MSNKSKTIIIITGIIIIALIVSFLALDPIANIRIEESDKMSEEEGQKTAQDTEDLINEVKELVKEIEKNKEKSISKVVKIKGVDGGESEAIIVAPGSNPISVETGAVMSSNGGTIKNNVEAGSDEAPQPSLVIDLEKLPKNTIVLEMTSKSITPSEFRVRAGQAVSLAVTTVEKRSHTFRFDDESLSGVAIALSPYESKTISFNSPTTPGEYIYFSDIADYREKGAVGKMIVE